MNVDRALTAIMLVILIFAVGMAGYEIGVAGVREDAIQQGYAKQRIEDGAFMWKTKHDIAYEYLATTFAPRWSAYGGGDLNITIPRIPKVEIK